MFSCRNRKPSHSVLKNIPDRLYCLIRQPRFLFCQKVVMTLVFIVYLTVVAVPSFAQVTHSSLPKKTAATKPPSPATTKGLDFHGPNPVLPVSYAVVVGVNQYPNLRPGASLSSAVSDAQRVGELLKSQGFRVVLLTDTQATYDAILATLHVMQTIYEPAFATGMSASARSIKGSRFVFYFAGHGTRTTDGTGSILPSDARDDSEQKDIKSLALHDTIAAIPANTRTIIIDSSHSGDMVLPSNTSNNTISDSICYFVSSLKTQLSNETNTEGKPSSIFTYYLLKELSSGKYKTWNELVPAVVAAVRRDSENEQTPQFTPIFLNRPIWGSQQ